VVSLLVNSVSLAVEAAILAKRAPSLNPEGGGDRRFPLSLPGDPPDRFIPHRRARACPAASLEAFMRRPISFHGSVVTILALLAAACSGGSDEAAPSTAVAYEGARVIVGNSQVIERATVVVDNGRFVDVGATGAVDVPAGATRVDLTGRTVMPAIIDTHVHLSTTREALLEDLRQRAYWGVGAAMSLGSDPDDLAFEIRAQEIPGSARYRTAGRGITRPEPGRTEVPYWIDTADQARQAVQELADKNVDIVKIWVDDRDGQYPKLTPELYGAVIDEAHAHDLRVTAHIFTLEDAKGLLRAGIDAFAHGVRDRDIDDEFVRMVDEHPALVLVPNLPGRGVPADVSWLEGGVSAEQFAALQKQSAAENPAAQAAFGIQARNLKRMSDEGVFVALGSDGNTPWGPHQEMEDMVIAGMSPADVLVAATGHGAEFLRLDEAGTIETGKSADFIVLEANPLDDITNTRRIESVYMRGEAVDRSVGVAAE